MIILQLGNSIFTTRYWLITPVAVTCLFLNPYPCNNCQQRHVMAIRVPLAHQFD